MTTDPLEVARTLADAARTMGEARSVETALDTIVQSALHAVPGFEHASAFTVARRDELELVAGTDPSACELAYLQHSLDEGPSIDALRQDSVVMLAHAGQEHRWPRFGAAASRRGVHAQLSMRLAVGRRTFGCLTLYASRVSSVDRSAAELIRLFATHAALALARLRTEDQLRAAVSTRQVIGQAMGLISQRYRVNGDRAFGYLVRTSQTTNTKLREIAAQIVESADELYGSSTP